MTLYKHTCAGAQPAGDFWSTGLYTQSDSSLEVVANHWMNFLNLVGGNLAMGSLWPTGTRIDEATTYSIDPGNGRATGVFRDSLSITGQSAGGQPPPRDSIVVGLRTANPGRTGRGRQYWPALSETGTDATTGLWTQISADQAASFFKSGFDQLVSVGVSPGVYSRVSPGPGLFGMFRPLTGLTISKVPGNQRRRSNKILPQYSAEFVDQAGAFGADAAEGRDARSTLVPARNTWGRRR